MQEESQREVFSAKQIKISEIKENTPCVSIIGKIKSENNELVLFNESGEIFLQSNQDISNNVEFYRIIGKPFIKNNLLFINVEIVNELKNLNMELYNKIMEREQVINFD